MIMLLKSVYDELVKTASATLSKKQNLKKKMKKWLISVNLLWPQTSID